MQSAHLSRRCGAKTRNGTECRSPAVRGKRRCRMHGGNSPGAPRCNQNALKHGRYTPAAKLERLKIRQTMRELQRLVELALDSDLHK
jgi:glucans biosynthesis protein